MRHAAKVGIHDEGELLSVLIYLHDTGEGGRGVNLARSRFTHFFVVLFKDYIAVFVGQYVLDSDALNFPFETRHLPAAGSIIFFDEEKLRDCVVLDPYWLAEVPYSRTHGGLWARLISLGDFEFCFCHNSNDNRPLPTSSTALAWCKVVQPQLGGRISCANPEV